MRRSTPPAAVTPPPRCARAAAAGPLARRSLAPRAPAWPIPLRGPGAAGIRRIPVPTRPGPQAGWGFCGVWEDVQEGGSGARRGALFRCPRLPQRERERERERERAVAAGERESGCHRRCCCILAGRAAARRRAGRQPELSPSGADAQGSSNKSPVVVPAAAAALYPIGGGSGYSGVPVRPSHSGGGDACRGALCCACFGGGDRPAPLGRAGWGQSENLE
jgi:hypothetical protein